MKIKIQVRRLTNMEREQYRGALCHSCKSRTNKDEPPLYVCKGKRVIGYGFNGEEAIKKWAEQMLLNYGSKFAL